MTEEQLDEMSLRTFHNLLSGRNKKEKAKRQLEELRHGETILAMLSPHMKEKDRKKAYAEFYSDIKQVAKEVTAKKEKGDPIKFWENIDNKLKPESKGTSHPRGEKPAP